MRKALDALGEGDLLIVTRGPVGAFDRPDNARGIHANSSGRFSNRMVDSAVAIGRLIWQEPAGR
jgi:hypothetical protein